MLAITLQTIECVGINRSQRGTPFHEELLSALAEGPGLILVTGSTGQGKTTAIERALADPACPPTIAFVGDIRGDVADAERAVQLARSQRVLGVLRIPRATGAPGRLLDMGISATDLAEVTRAIFTTRLYRHPLYFLLIHERLHVTAPIRNLILAGADQDAVHRQAIADGMRSLHRAGLDHVRAGRLTMEAVVAMNLDD